MNSTVKFYCYSVTFSLGLMLTCRAGRYGKKFNLDFFHLKILIMILLDFFFCVNKLRASEAT